MGIGLCQCVEKWMGVCVTSKWEALPLQKIYGGGVFGELWRKKVDRGKRQWCIIKDRLTVYTPRKKFETIYWKSHLNLIPESKKLLSDKVYPPAVV